MITTVLSRDTTTEIVDLEMFTEHSRITDLYDEIVLQQCLDAAHDAVQHWLNRPLYPTTILGIEEVFKPVMYLPNPKVHSIDFIKAEDEEYNEVMLIQDTDWKFDEVNESIRFLTRTSETLFTELSRYSIQYTCGYMPDDELCAAPPAVKHAILMTAATLYENREDTIVGTQINSVPLDAQRLIRVHRRRVGV